VSFEQSEFPSLSVTALLGALQKSQKIALFYVPGLLLVYFTKAISVIAGSSDSSTDSAAARIYTQVVAPRAPPMKMSVIF